ncbi:restriction endonuclease [Nonomuraea sp. NPDC050663]|uniref:restriction endonuclease n=1 Tax=Nonomuraea sp. NPDC050663 TaxID=3364370 RepID=UPI0037A75478
MAIPDFETVMRPVLELLQEGGEHRRRDIGDAIAKSFNLTPVEQAQRTRGGGHNLLRSKIDWAIRDLVKAGLLVRTRRGFTQVTDRGRTFLAEHSGAINREALSSVSPEHAAWVKPTKTKKAAVPTDSSDAEEIPREAIPRLVARWHEAIADELLQRLRAAPPEFLEHTVLALLVAMGYGGAVSDAVHLGGPGDGGVDGMVRKDPLGLEQVYVQAKRYAADHPVGPAEVQAFVGALHGHQTDRGVFVTTSHFTKSAADYVAKVSSRIILIDGLKLARLMVEHGCGVHTGETITLKEVDEDFFDA